MCAAPSSRSTREARTSTPPVEPPPGVFDDDPEIVPFRAALEDTMYSGPSAVDDFWDAAGRAGPSCTSSSTASSRSARACSPSGSSRHQPRDRAPTSSRGSPSPATCATVWSARLASHLYEERPARELGVRLGSGHAHARGAQEAPCRGAALLRLRRAAAGLASRRCSTEALANGADMIQLRDKGLGDGELLEAARVFRAAADAQDALFLLNDRPDLVARCGADGAHVGQDDIAPSDCPRRCFRPTRCSGSRRTRASRSRRRRSSATRRPTTSAWGRSGRRRRSAAGPGSASS